MKIGELYGFEVHIPVSGGKAGAGYNKTSTVQVRKGNCIVKQFKFTMQDDESRRAALRKAKEFILEPSGGYVADAKRDAESMKMELDEVASQRANLRDMADKLACCLKAAHRILIEISDVVDINQYPAFREIEAVVEELKEAGW